MQRALRVEPRGHWPKDAARASVTLDHEARHRRRMRYAADTGEWFLLDLPHAVAMGDGAGLAMEDGGWIEVRAAIEPLLEITAVPDLLLRLAWHIGNRHVPASIEPGRILIRDDHVLADMLTRQGATLRRVDEPFTPEAGAYDGHRHDH